MPTANLKRFIDNIAAFDFGSVQESAIESNKEALTQYQAEQFSQGKDKQGDPILLDGHGYNTFYADKKRKYGIGLGTVTDRVTLFLTGALYKELFSSIVVGNVTFSSRVPYFTTLMQRTGDVTGINETNAREFAIERVLPFVSKELQTKTGLKISVGGRVLA